MANYTSELKAWGSTGSIYPDGYNYLGGERPVDEWDNFFNHNSERDIKHLVELTNKRLESSKGSSYPAAPEVGELSWRTDNKRLAVHTGTAWREVMFRDGDTMTGHLNMNDFRVNNIRELTFPENGGDRTLVNMNVTSSATAGSEQSVSVELDGEEQLKLYAEADGSGGLQNTRTFLNGSALDTQVFSKQEGGEVAYGSTVPLGQFGLEPGESLLVSQAVLSENGFTTAAASGVDLILADDTGSTTTILSGNGSTVYDNETGNPLVEYENTSAAHRTVMIGVDNGNYGGGAGQAEKVFAGYICRVV